MLDIMNISTHDNVSEQDALNYVLKNFYPGASLHLKPCEKNLPRGGLHKEGLFKGVDKKKTT